jgi:serine/threonine protein kinase
MVEPGLSPNWAAKPEWPQVVEALESSRRPQIASGLHHDYEIVEVIRAEGAAVCAKGFLCTNPNIEVFIKFAPENLVDSEWEMQCQLPDDIHIHRAIDLNREGNEIALGQEAFPQEIFDNPDVIGAHRSVNAVPFLSLHFIVSPFIEGCDLFDMVVPPFDLRPQPLPCDQIVDFGLMILSGLAILHQHRIVHCDIKPENIMWSYGERVLKIVDFAFSRKSWEFQIYGTDRYLAPEVGHETQAAYPSRDIYAFGCLLSFLATGHFREGDEHSKWLKEVIERMTSDERMARGTAEEWLEEFDLARKRRPKKADFVDPLAQAGPRGVDGYIAEAGPFCGVGFAPGH